MQNLSSEHQVLVSCSLEILIQPHKVYVSVKPYPPVPPKTKVLSGLYMAEGKDTKIHKPHSYKLNKLPIKFNCFIYVKNSCSP